MDKVLKLKGVSLTKGEESLLTDIDLEVGAGEIFALCGREGSGKTYAARAVCRLLDDNMRLSGTIFLDKMELTKLSSEDMRFARLCSIGIAAPNELSPCMTIEKQISLAFSEGLKKTPAAALRDAALIMRHMGLDSERCLRLAPRDLTGDELHRAAFAVALAADPAVLFFRAPDPVFKETALDEVYTLILKICKIKNTAVMMLCEDLSFAAKYAERAAVIHGGAIVEAGSAKELFSSPVHGASIALKKSLEPPVFPDTEAGEVLYNAENLSLRPIARGLSFCVSRGETVGISGDLRLARLLSGAVRPESGRLYVPVRAPKNQKSVCLIPSFSRDALYGGHTVLENLYFKKLSPGRAAQKFFDSSRLFSRAGLENSLARAMPHTLSKLQISKVLLLRAALYAPDILICCDPSPRLDTVGRAEIAGIIRELFPAAILVTKDEWLLENACDRQIGEGGAVIRQREKELGEGLEEKFEEGLKEELEEGFEMPSST